MSKPTHELNRQSNGIFPPRTLLQDVCSCTGECGIGCRVSRDGPSRKPVHIYFDFARWRPCRAHGGQAPRRVQGRAGYGLYPSPFACAPSRRNARRCFSCELDNSHRPRRSGNSHGSIHSRCLDRTRYLRLNAGLMLRAKHGLPHHQWSPPSRYSSKPDTLLDLPVLRPTAPHVCAQHSRRESNRGSWRQALS